MYVSSCCQKMREACRCGSIPADRCSMMCEPFVIVMFVVVGVIDRLWWVTSGQTPSGGGVVNNNLERLSKKLTYLLFPMMIPGGKVNIYTVYERVILLRYYCTSGL